MQLQNESLDRWKNRIGGKYSTNKKTDVAVQTVIDLNMEEIQENIQTTLENLEKEHKEYIQTNFESDESYSSEEDENEY